MLGLVASLCTTVSSFAADLPIQVSAAGGTVVRPATINSDSGTSSGQAVQFAATPATSPAGFVHPGLLDSLGQLDYVKSKIAAGASPWIDMFNRMKASPLAAATYTPAPTATLDCSAYNAGCQKEETDGRAAYTNALLWYYTGNAAYAQKSIAILNAWSTTQTSATTYTQNYVNAAWYAEMYPRAAEIIRYTYTPSAGQTAFNVSAFTNLLVNVWAPLLGPNSPQSQSSNGNWDLSMIDGLANIGIFTDSRTIFQNAIDRWRARVPAYIYLTSDNSGSGVPIAPPGGLYNTAKKVQCFWLGSGSASTTCDTSNFALSNGQSQETCRDYQHVSLGLSSIFDTAETARTQGVDLYGEQRDRLVAGLEFNAAVVNSQVYPSASCAGAVTTPVAPITDPTFSIGYTEFAARLGLSLPNTFATVQRIQAGQANNATDHQMTWEELTHFDGGNTCTTPDTSLGVDTISVNVPTAGAYRLWTRVKPASATGTSYHAQVDGNCALSVGGATLSPNQWTWVDYQNGDPTSKVDLPLSAGTHSITLAGQSAGLAVDGVLLSDDPSCVPSADGSNCQADTSPPSAPTNVVSASVTSTGLTLSWDASTDGVGVDHYVVTRDGAVVGTPATNSFTDTGLSAATAYSYSVAAVDLAGNQSSASPLQVSTAAAPPPPPPPPPPPSSPPPDTTAPSAPGGLTATNITETGLTLAWTASTDDVGVDHYVVSRNGAVIGTVSGATFADSGLSAATGYTYTVLAADAAGNQSLPSSPLQVSTVDTTAPSVPTGLVATGITRTSATLSWTPSTDNVGVAGYLVSRDGTGIGTVTGSTFTDTGLTAGTYYSYAVTAVDAAGNLSAGSASVQVTTSSPLDTTPPSTPGSFTAKVNSPTTVTLSWTAASDNVGVDHYSVQRGLTTLVASQTGLSFIDSTAPASSTLTYSVIAYDAAGNSSVAAQYTVSTPAPPDTVAPSVPAGLAVTGVTVSSATLSWSASTDNVGTTGYEVYRGGVKVASTAARTFTDTGLTAATAYSYSVLAYDAAGNRSVQSGAVIATTTVPPDTTPPTSPATFSATVSALNQVTLTWSAATDNVRVAGYRISRGGVLIATTTSLTYIDAGLAPNTSYGYTVTAVDAAGNSSAVKTATVITPLDAAPLGAGFAGAYFNNTTLSGAAIGRLDSAINFNWGAGAPMPGISADDFSVRWTGRLTPTTSGTYTFYTQTDDGVRLYLNDKIVIDGWTSGPANRSATVALTAGTAYNLRVEYFEAAGSAVAALLWSGPGTAKATLPAAVMSSAANGLSASYFANIALSGPAAVQRLDPGVNFDWGTGSPDPRLPADNFSARWTGKIITPATSGVYTFYSDSDDGTRVYVNGQLVINNWTAHAITTNTGTITLAANTSYAIKVEHAEVSGTAVSKLSWSYGKVGKTIVPATSLRDR